ncbi:MAG: FtsX-like permease family protein [Devosia sp.]
MTAVAIDAEKPSRRGAPLSLLAWRFAWREMRGGLRGFYVFLACIALGVGTIAAVNSLATGLSQGIAAEGQSLLGGDVAFSLIHRRASDEERAYLDTQGIVSEVATLRAMARTEGASQTLVELKAVDNLYPIYGSLDLASGRPVAEVMNTGNPVAVVDESLLATADLAIGDTISLGRLNVEIADTIDREPDRLAGGIAFGPRVMIAVDDLEASGLVRTGSLVRWRYRVAGADGQMGDGALQSLVADARERFPAAGWRIETRTEAAPGLRRSIDRFAQFLTLVGLTSLAVGGVGVANAVRAYLAKKRATIATLRSLGSSGALVVRIYLVQILLLAMIGTVFGLALGAIAPPVAGLFLADLLPVSALFSLFPGALALAALYGILTALTFAMWPLGKAHSVPPTALFRDELDDRATRSRYKFAAATAAFGAVLAVFVVVAAYDRLLAAIYVGAAIAIFLLLRLVAIGITAIARAAPRSRSTVVRMAVANIHRRGALTPTVTLSLGLSLTLLVTLSLIDGNLRQTLMSRLPAAAPSFFFVDIQDSEKDQFLARLEAVAPDASIQSQPMLRGRIVAINDVRAEDYPETEASWVLRGDRGVTYASAPPPESRVVAGEWWPRNGPAANEVSFAAEIAGELGVDVGDKITVNVLGREVDATISNLRTVAWESLSINFVMVFSPNVFAGAPHAHLATLTFPDGAEESRELDVLQAMTQEFPTVTSVRVKEALETVNDVVSDLALAIRAAAAVTLIASILVLAGTLAASHRSRIYDAVILKTLGARRRTLLAAFALEYALLGAATAVFGIAAGTVAAWLISVELMELSFVFLPWTAVGAVGAALLVTVGLGLVGTWRALGEKPAPVLRNL